MSFTDLLAERAAIEASETTSILLDVIASTLSAELLKRADTTGKIDSSNVTKETVLQLLQTTNLGDKKSIKKLARTVGKKSQSSNKVKKASKATAWQVFCATERKVLKEERPGLKPSQVLSELGSAWRSLSAQDKKKYQDLADQQNSSKEVLTDSSISELDSLTE